MTPTLGQRIRQHRTARGLTLREVADAIGMSKTWVTDLERGRHLPTDEDLLARLAFCLRDDWTALQARAQAERASRAGQVQAGALRAAPQSFEAVEAAAHNACALLHPIECQEGEAIPVAFDMRHAAETGRRLGLSRPLEFKTFAWEAEGDPEARVRLAGAAVALELREDVWRRAAAGEARDRFTAAHALGHAVLHQEILKEASPAALFRDWASTTQPGEPQAYESAEWQATTFALAFLLPLGAVRAYLSCQRSSFSIAQLADRFGVTPAAATRRLEQLLSRLAAQQGA